MRHRGRLSHGATAAGPPDWDSMIGSDPVQGTAQIFNETLHTWRYSMIGSDPCTYGDAMHSAMQ